MEIESRENIQEDGGREREGRRNAVWLGGKGLERKNTQSERDRKEERC